MRAFKEEATMDHGTYEHIGVSESGFVATIEVRRGPNNFIDTDMVGEIADALEVYIKKRNGWGGRASRSSPPCMAPPLARESVSRSWRTSASPARRPAFPPTSTG